MERYIFVEYGRRPARTCVNEPNYQPMHFDILNHFGRHPERYRLVSFKCRRLYTCPGWRPSHKKPGLDV